MNVRRKRFIALLEDDGIKESVGSSIRSGDRHIKILHGGREWPRGRLGTTLEDKKP